MMGEQGETWTGGKTQKERSGHKDTRAQRRRVRETAHVPKQRETWRTERHLETSVEWMPSTVSEQQGVTGMACLPTALSSTDPTLTAGTWPPTAVLLLGQGRGTGPCRNRFQRPQCFSLDVLGPKLSSELRHQLILHKQLPARCVWLLGQSHHQKLVKIKMAHLAGGGKVLSTYFALCPPHVILASRQLCPVYRSETRKRAPTVTNITHPFL